VGYVKFREKRKEEKEKRGEKGEDGRYRDRGRERCIALRIGKRKIR